MRETYTFDDVLIKPQYSTVRSRKDVDLSVELTKGLKFKVPVFPANMKTVVNHHVAEEMIKLGGLCLMHRFASFESQLDDLKILAQKYNNWNNYVGVSIGAKDIDKEYLAQFIHFGVKIVCIDVAHGDHISCIEMIKYISNKYPQVFLIAGNVATGRGAYSLWSAGADACKIGVGQGSICTTRITTGAGIPQWSALEDVYEMRKQYPHKFIIADGGCSKVGDLVKSLALSDLVMTGNLFSGSIEIGGERFEKNGISYAKHEGSSTHKSDYIEGVKAIVKAKGHIKDIVSEMCQGISSGCSYVGAHNLKELQQKAVFVKVSAASIKENGAHDVMIVERK